MDIGKINSALSSGSLTNGAVQSANQATDNGFAKALEAAAKNGDDKELKQACQQFESLMLDMLYKSMKSTVIKSDLIEEDAGTNIYETMQDEALMGEVAKKGTFGLAESLYKQLSKTYGTGKKNGNQEAVQKTEPASEKGGE